MPYYYIGSKSNCSYDGTNIIDSKGKYYYGSSKKDGFQELIKKEKVIVHVLSTHEDYNECLLMEKNIQEQNDVVADPRYFNRSIAMKNRFHDPGYGTFRHTLTKKFVRLPKEHPRVLSGEYVNANKGYKTYNNGEIEKQFLDEDVPKGWIKGRLEKNKRFGEDNHFYGRTHDSKAIEKMKQSQNEYWENNPEHKETMRRVWSETAKKTFTGVPKTEESNRKRSRPGLIILKNTHTDEVIRIKKEDKTFYDESVWVNPYSYKMKTNPDIRECPHCGKIGKGSIMSRWHFDKCKER